MNALESQAGAAAPPPAEFIAQVAEAAYYKAEARGFEPGYELADWYAAEQEIKAMMERAPAEPKPKKVA